MDFWRRLLLGSAVLVAIGAPVVFGLAAAQQGAAPLNEFEQHVQQEAAQFGPDLKYDVTSVRVNKSGSGRGRFLPDGLALRNMSFDALFAYAYGNVRPYMIFGKPDWWDSERYDVLAKTDGSVAERLQKLPPAQRGLAREWMVQGLLADRFKLKVHWETRQLPLYVMTVAKGGPKFKEAPARRGFRIPRWHRRQTAGRRCILDPRTRESEG